jgi:TolA-binding protein
MNARPIVFAASSLLLCTVLSSCSSITLLRIQELKQVEAHVDSLKAMVDSQQAALRSEEKSQNELLRLIRADMQVRFEELGQKITSLEGALSENKYKLSLIDKKTQEIQDQVKAKAAADSAAAAQKNAQVEKLYQIACGDYNASRWDLAANGFQDLINQYPESPLADESSYWYAECFASKKEYDKAEQLLSDYLRKFRNGKKVCAALYGLGLVFEGKKQPDKRKLVWQKLLSTCPDSPEAKIVKEKTGK